MGFEWTAAGPTTSARYAVATGLDGLMELPTEERRGPLFTAVFARAAAPVMREDLAPIIDRVRPDLVVRETAELAAAPMAAARGIPLVTVAFSGVLPDRARGQVVDALRPLWQAEGLGDPSWADVYGQLYLHPFPASFGQRPDSTVVRPIRPDRGLPSVAPAESLRPTSPGETDAPVTDDGRDMLGGNHVAEVARLLPGYVARASIGPPLGSARSARSRCEHCWQSRLNGRRGIADGSAVSTAPRSLRATSSTCR